MTALFGTFLWAAFLAGVVLILGSAILNADHDSSYVVDLLRDLGIGLIVSVFVVVFIEWRSALTLQEEIATKAVEAVYRRIVPPEIYDQIRDSVFQSDVLRRRWRLEVTVVSPRADEDTYTELRRLPGYEDVVVLESEISFELENLHDANFPFVVIGGIDFDLLPAPGLAIPRFTLLEIGGNAWEEKELERAAREVYLDRGVQTLNHGLTLRRTGRGLEFAEPITLPRGRFTTVRYHVRRAIRSPGNYVLYCPTPADGIEITIRGADELGLEFEVRPLHSQADQISRVGSTGTWKFPFGILPWQGFQIVSRKSVGSAAGEVASA